MKTHIIEWRRLVRQGRTCDRCGDTGETLRQVVRELNAGCGAKRARFRLKTTRQDVFLKIVRRAEDLPEPAKLQGWIFLIARHAIIDHYRTRKETVAVPETLATAADTAPEEAEGLNVALRRMISGLPEPYREAILLTEIEGMPQVTLAKRLGLSVSGAKSRVQRGRQMLKKMLLDCCQFEFDQRGGINECMPRGNDCPECGPATTRN